MGRGRPWPAQSFPPEVPKPHRLPCSQCGVVPGMNLGPQGRIPKFASMGGSGFDQSAGDAAPPPLWPHRDPVQYQIRRLTPAKIQCCRQMPQSPAKRTPCGNKAPGVRAEEAAIRIAQSRDPDKATRRGQGDKRLSGPHGGTDQRNALSRPGRQGRDLRTEMTPVERRHSALQFIGDAAQDTGWGQWSGHSGPDFRSLYRLAVLAKVRPAITLSRASFIMSAQAELAASPNLSPEQSRALQRSPAQCVRHGFLQALPFILVLM